MCLKNLKNLDWSDVLGRLEELATSEQGRTSLRQTAPLSSIEDAKNSVSEILEMCEVVSPGWQFSQDNPLRARPQMTSLDLFTPWFQRLTKNAVLRPLELKDVRHFCFETLALSDTIKDLRTSFVMRLNSHLLPAEEPLSAIDQIMTHDGDIRSDASEKLHHLNIEKSNLAKQVNTTLERLVRDYQLEYMLQDRFVTTREGRWVLPIKSGLQHGFQGVVHAASQSKQTVFMEPQEVIPLNNRLREIEVEIEIEIERLLTDLSQYLSTLCFQFEETRNALLEADIRLSQAALTILLQAQPCEFSSKLDLRNVRHPLLVLNKSSKGKIVTNTVELNSDKRILLLSGPNAGGKTVLLKSIGLAAQMARCGLPICSDQGSQLPFFEKLVVSIGDAQSVDANLSTFAAHLKTLDTATHYNGPHTLLLIDEICGSTDPEEGAALARSFIETYKENGVFGVITSHLGALKRGWQDNSGLINGSLDFDKNAGPTYRFIMGVPGQSLAIQTAKRAGVSEKIIKRAFENLSPDLRKYQESFVEVDRVKQELLHLQDLLSAELKTAQKEKEKYEKALADFEQERTTRLEKEIHQAQCKIEALVQESKVQDVFRRHETLQKIKHEMPKVISQAFNASHSGEFNLSHGHKSITSADEFAKTYPPGSTIYIHNLGRDGIVQGLPNSKGEVPVLSSSIRLILSWEELMPSVTQTKKTNNKVSLKSKVFSPSVSDADRVVDLRGRTSEEALSELEIQLDAASLASEDRLKIIHGHGTDTLKRAVRSYLSRSVYVKKWSAGTPETGGDGITWVEIK